jgi:DNA methyltransferase 1-associated protein 1
LVNNNETDLMLLWLLLDAQIEEEEKLMQELKKIEQRKKEREKKTLDLQKLITAADSNAETKRPERKTTKKMIVCKVKETSVRLSTDIPSFYV